MRWDGPGTRATVGTFATPSSAPVNTEHWHVTGGFVYLAAINVDEIVVCPLPSCGSAWGTYLMGDDAHVASMTGDDARVYWVGYDRVLSCAVGPTCAGAREELGASRLGSAKPRSVVLGGGRLYVATTPSGIYECDPADCAGTVHLVSDDAVDLAYTQNGHGFVSDARALYYTAVAAGNERHIMKLAR